MSGSFSRREFIAQSLAVPALLAAGPSKLNHKERVDRALSGKSVDRPPFSLWRHFGLHTPEEHAQATLEFHRAYRTDIVKVMSDFPYPKPAGKWYELKPDPNPFPQQIRALELIRDGLGGEAYFIETIFNPWNVAEKLSSKAAVRQLKDEQPEALLNALDAIADSEIHHAKRAFAAGASGLLLSVANANKAEMSLEDYRKFSEPFDRKIFDATQGAKLNILHLHVEPEYLDRFPTFKAPIINYSVQVSGIPIAEVRQRFPAWVIAGGIDEVNYRTLSQDELRKQWQAASQAAGPRFILTPGCSVPNDTAPDELARLPGVLNA